MPYKCQGRLTFSAHQRKAFNESEKKEKRREKTKVKEVVILLKEPLKAHPVESEPRPYYSLLPLADVGTALLFRAQLFCPQTSAPLPFLHSAPDAELL